MASKIAMEAAESIYWGPARDEGDWSAPDAIKEIAEIIDAAINEALKTEKREPEGSLQP